MHLEAGLSYDEVGRVLKISKCVVGKYVSLARVAGVDFAVADGLSDDVLEARLYRPALARSSHQLTPNFGVIHQELKRPGVTLMLLWEEYAAANTLAGHAVSTARAGRCIGRGSCFIAGLQPVNSRLLR